MKKILLAVAAVAAFASCSQNEEFENVGQKAEIKIGTTAVTRATELNTVGLQDAGFQLYAYNTGTSAMTSEVVLPVSTWIADKATYASSAWTVAGGPYYWPLTEKLQFFAYSPVDGVTYTATDGQAKGFPKFTYTVGATAAAQKDLVISSALDKTKAASGATPTVSLTFKHALTQINIQVVQESLDYTYEITKDVTITGVKGSGTFTYTGENTGAWAASGDDVTYTYTLGDIKDGTDKSEVMTGNALMLIPQDLTNAKITISYKTKKGNSSYVFDGQKEIPLNSTTAWGFGTKILYKLTLPVGGEKVKVEATADDVWGTETTETTETPAPTV